jgi:hypothetical protein
MLYLKVLTCKDPYAFQFDLVIFLISYFVRPQVEHYKNIIFI